MKFKHLILTRFNIGLYNTKNHSAWMNHRIKIFEKYYISSIKKQRCNNFKVLLFLDKRTDSKDYDSIKNMLNSNMEIVTTDNIVIDRYNAIIKESKNFDIVATTRIDNDDMIMEWFVEKIQENIYNSLLPYGLNFPAGYCYDIRNKKIAGKFGEKSNHFITLVEPTINKLNTVFCGDHGNIGKKYSVQQLIENIPSWVRMIHSMNLSNVMPNGKNFEIKI